jgi:hypothetical protein
MSEDTTATTNESGRSPCLWCDYTFTLICSFAIFGGLTYFGTPWLVALVIAHGQTFLWFMRKTRQ